MIEDFLTQACSIEREAYTTALDGERVATRVPVAAAVPCLYRPLKASAGAMQGRDGSKVAGRFYFAGDAGLTIDGGTIFVLDDGRVFRPMDVIDVNSMGRLWHVDVEFVTG